MRASNIEGGAGSDWILVDLGDVVVHVMMPATREFYDLERFWRDAPDLGGGQRVTMRLRLISSGRKCPTGSVRGTTITPAGCLRSCPRTD